MYTAANCQLLSASVIRLYHAIMVLDLYRIFMVALLSDLNLTRVIQFVKTPLTLRVEQADFRNLASPRKRHRRRIVDVDANFYVVHLGRGLGWGKHRRRTAKLRAVRSRQWRWRSDHCGYLFGYMWGRQSVLTASTMLNVWCCLKTQ